MYTAFYGLREKPFALSPDPRFLYLAGSHREALAHLLYGIEQGEGFISVTGEVGTGKTTLCRTLLERLEGEVEIAFLFNPSRTALELLQSICAEFGLPAEGLARRSLMAQLNGFLLDKKHEGRRVLLIIDEAQTLSENTLEQVRLLSNLETSREKLIQILLLGQPELDRKLDERGLRQLRQRISVRWQLLPLAPNETRAYIRHRLAVAAGEPKDLFSESALREVHRRTRGIPRLVNQLCDRSLLVGYADRAAMIGSAFVRAAAKEIPDTRRSRDRAGREKPNRPWLPFATLCLLVAVGMSAGLGIGRDGLSRAMQGALFKDSKGQVAAAVSAAESAADLVHPAVAAPPPTLARLVGPVAAESQLDPVISATDDRPTGASDDADRVTALAPGLLARILEARDPHLAMRGTEQALLERFGRKPPDLGRRATTAEALQASLRARGLEATSFEGGSLRLLERLDHPVALALRFPSDASSRAETSSSPIRWVAALGFDADRVRVAGLIEDREVTIPIEEFERHWTDTGIVVWERFERIPEVLGRNDRGGAVIWLQSALAELHFYRAQPTGRFDNATADALERFQRERGLLANGIVGPLTQIALFGQLERYPVPRLSADPDALGSDRADSPSSPAVESGERG